MPEIARSSGFQPILDKSRTNGWLAPEWAGWLNTAGLRTGGMDNLHLALQPVLDADFLHDVQLGLKPVDMFFGIFQDVLE